MVAPMTLMTKNNRLAMLSQNISNKYLFSICMFMYTVMFLLFQKSLKWQHFDSFSIQAEYDAMLLEFAGEGIPLVAAAVSADKFAPYLNDLLPLIMSKAVSPWEIYDHTCVL